MNLALPFSGKTALVTGSGRGIGRAIALHFARNGADVVVNFFRNRAPAEQTAAEIEKLGRRALLVKADVGDLDDLNRLFDETGQAFGGLISSFTMPPPAITGLRWNRNPKAGTGP